MKEEVEDHTEKREENDGQNGVGEVRRSKRPRRSKSSVKYVDASNTDDDIFADADENVDSDSDVEITLEEEPKDGEEKKQTFNCLHCEKPFTTPNGLQYHIDNYVCRNEDGTPKPYERKKGRGKARARSSTQKKDGSKFRGTKEERTCPHCNRMFTSISGMEYHVGK